MIGIGTFIGTFVAGAAVGMALVGGAGTSVAVASVPAPTDTGRAVVDHVVDGDTLDVRFAGVMRRIRLLNIDAPETVDPNRPVGCLGPEASAFLKNLLPAGTVVTLGYDKERTDRYDRTLAAVYTSTGALVNAEVARQGLAAALVVGDNDRFYAPVARARDEAVAAHRGLYATDVACTVPAQVQALTKDATAASVVDPQASSAQLDANADAAARVAAVTVVLEKAFTTSAPEVAWSALPTAEQQRLAALVADVREKVGRAESAARAAAGAAREREAAAGRAEEERRKQDARERQERVRREAEAAAEAKAATRAKADAAHEKARAIESKRKKSDSGGSAAGGGSRGGPPGYTGRRCYAPGGKTWRPC